MANFTGLAAARHAVLRAHGWDVEAQGLFGAPPITVVVGDEVHVSVLKGAEHARPRARARRPRARRRPGPNDRDDNCRASHGPTIVCTQAGNVNTGAFDPIGEIVARLRGDRRVDSRRRRVRAVGRGCAREARTGRRRRSRGFAGDRRAQVAQRALRQRPGLRARPATRSMRRCRRAPRICIAGETRDPHLFVPEMSRRARAVEVWAALRSLGRRGLAELIERNCRARRALRRRAARGRTTRS